MLAASASDGALAARRGGVRAEGSPVHTGLATTTSMLRSTFESGCIAGPPQQRFDSTWAIGGRKAREREKQQHIYTPAQFYQAPFDTAYEKIAHARQLRKLESLFYEADEDGSGTLELDEFKNALKHAPIRKAFARLGIQRHQSELVFKTFDVKKTGELSIQEFMHGLHGVVGNLDFNAEAKELDIEVLKPRNRASARSEAVHNAAQSGAEAPRSSRRGVSRSLGSAQSLPTLSGPGSQQQLQRAFVQSALASALHPATAKVGR